MSRSRPSIRARSGATLIVAEPVELETDADGLPLVAGRGQGLDVGVQVGVCGLVPELVIRDPRRLDEAMAVLGQGELGDAARAGGCGVAADPLAGHEARPEHVVVGCEVAVVVDEH